MIETCPSVSSASSVENVNAPNTFTHKLDNVTTTTTTTTENISNEVKTKSEIAILPSSVRNVIDCAKYEIHLLHSKVNNPNNNNDNYVLTEDEEDAIDDGFMMCDINVVRSKLYAWYKLFPRVKPYFAVKCNPDREVSKVLETSLPSIGFDCASLKEINLAASIINQKCNSNSSSSNPEQQIATVHRPKSKLDIFHIVYANPQRSEYDLEMALSMGVTAMTFDGPEELYKIRAAYDKLSTFNQQQQQLQQQEADSKILAKPQMILRILVPDGASSVPLGEKFGAPPSRVKSLTELAYQLDLPVIGISFHCGSGCHDPSNYATALRLARDAMDVVNETLLKLSQQNEQTAVKEEQNKLSNCNKKQPCWLIDMGGGYPGSDGIGGDNERFSSIPTTLATTTTTTSNNDEINNSSSSLHESTANIAKVVVPLLDELFPKDEVTVISEPGRYFVEAAFVLVSRIYKVRVEEYEEDDEKQKGVVITRRRYHYSIAHGVQGVFKDVLLCGESFIPTPLKISKQAGTTATCMKDDDATTITTENARNNEELFPSTIHGPSGDPSDIVSPNCLLPPLTVDDWLVFDRMGAYTLSIASYGGRPIIRYVEGGKG